MLGVKKIVDFSVGGHRTQNYGKEPEYRSQTQGKTVGNGSH